MLGIFIIILTYFISIGWSRTKAIKFANFEAISRITKRKLFPSSPILLIIRIFSLAFLILAISEVGIWYPGQVSFNDYVLIIDASGSMLADDYEPNRIEAAKEAANSFVKLTDPQTKVGIIAFAGTPLLFQSMTEDKEKVAEAIRAINIIESGGTAIGDAIALGVNILEAGGETEKGKNIILLTDGQSNVGLEVENAVEYASANGVIIHSIGIGTEEGGQFIDDVAISQINPDSLKKIADETGGKFYISTSKEELGEVYQSIYSSKDGQIFFDAKKYLLIAAFVFLLIEFVLLNTRYKTIV